MEAADEQTGDFFMPPADDGAAAFAAPPGDDVGFVGTVDAAPPADGGDFFSPPPAASDSADAPIILGEPPAAAPAGVEAASDDEGEAPPAADAGAPSLLPPQGSSAMAKWNEEWQATLLARKDEENAVKAAAVEKAREDVAAFQAEREKRRETRMVKNRSDEQDKLEAIEADLENDNSYQRVVKMIELNQDNQEGSADTGRMKDVLVLLKNEPARAEALIA